MGEDGREGWMEKMKKESKGRVEEGMSSSGREGNVEKGS